MNVHTGSYCCFAAVIGHHVFDIADQMEFCSLINPNELRQQRYMTVFTIHNMYVLPGALCVHIVQGNWQGDFLGTS